MDQKQSERENRSKKWGVLIWEQIKRKTGLNY